MPFFIIHKQTQKFNLYGSLPVMIDSYNLDDLKLENHFNKKKEIVFENKDYMIFKAPLIRGGKNFKDNVSENKYRLEFSEEQQSFHLAYYDDKRNTNGYITVLEECTEEEKNIVKENVLKGKNKFLSISEEHKITLKEVVEEVKKLFNRN